MKDIFLSQLLYVVTINLSVSRDFLLLLYVKPKGYEVYEHIATRVEENPRIISTLKKENYI